MTPPTSATQADRGAPEPTAVPELHAKGPQARRGIDFVDFASGILLIGIALLALALSWPLPLGEASNMGPGYVPQLLCYVQLTLGGVIVAWSVLSRGQSLEACALRPLIFVLASVAFFGLAIERLGLVVAVVGLVLISCIAHRGTRPHEAVLLGGALAAFAVLVFVKALGLPMQAWPHLGL